MGEAFLTFQNENIDGYAAVGTYLAKAAAEFGILQKGICDQSAGIHFCKITILNNDKDILSDRTLFEAEYLNGQPDNIRLGCQTVITKEGEITIVTEKERETEADDKDAQTGEREAYRTNFAEMPLEQKIADLIRFEAMTLSETFSTVLNSPFTLADMALGVLADFGLAKEKNEREENRPPEHREDEPTMSETVEEAVDDIVDAVEPEVVNENKQDQ